jgi:hypothetical protein
VLEPTSHCDILSVAIFLRQVLEPKPHCGVFVVA